MAGPTDAAGKNELRIVGAATAGSCINGTGPAASRSPVGTTGWWPQLDGGYLDAGQGTGGAMNVTGSALTVSVRLRNPSGRWGQPLFSKHGGHDALVFNLFSSESAIGFELGTRDTPAMTQVLAPLEKIGATDWHDVVCRYDGKTPPDVRRRGPDG